MTGRASLAAAQGLEDADRDRRLFERGRRSVTLPLNAIADFFAEVPEQIKVMKVGEENGEAVEAYIGLVGANVRKGYTHDRQDVAKELADVIITAWVALGDFSGDPLETLEVRAAEIVDRLGIRETERSS